MDIERKVADFISNGFYVDDGGTSVRNQEEADDLTMTTDQALHSIKMKVKGWSISFRPPSCDVTDDSTVGFAGMTWVPEIDSYSLKIQRLHLGKKKRGRFPDSLEMFKGGSMEDFVPEILTRKIIYITSIIIIFCLITTNRLFMQCYYYNNILSKHYS